MASWIVTHLFFSPTIFSQIQIGTLSGIVLDAIGAILAGARISLENPLTGPLHHASTDACGAFTFNNVPLLIISTDLFSSLSDRFQHAARHKAWL
jgi:hypothetical protein